MARAAAQLLEDLRRRCRPEEAVRQAEAHVDGLLKLALARPLGEQAPVDPRGILPGHFPYVGEPDQAVVRPRREQEVGGSHLLERDSIEVAVIVRLGAEI